METRDTRRPSDLDLDLSPDLDLDPEPRHLCGAAAAGAAPPDQGGERQEGVEPDKDQAQCYRLHLLVRPPGREVPLDLGGGRLRIARQAKR